MRHKLYQFLIYYLFVGVGVALTTAATSAPSGGCDLERVQLIEEDLLSGEIAIIFYGSRSGATKENCVELEKMDNCMEEDSPCRSAVGRLVDRVSDALSQTSAKIMQGILEPLERAAFGKLENAPFFVAGDLPSCENVIERFFYEARDMDVTLATATFETGISFEGVSDQFGGYFLIIDRNANGIRRSQSVIGGEVGACRFRLDRLFVLVRRGTRS